VPIVGVSWLALFADLMITLSTVVVGLIFEKVGNLLVERQLHRTDAEVSRHKRRLIESPWSRCTSQCRRFGHPPRLDNQPCGLQHENGQIVTLFSFEAVNNFAILFFIAGVQSQLVTPKGGAALFGLEFTCNLETVACVPAAAPTSNATGGGIVMASDDCKADTGQMEVPRCMGELQLQLVIIFTVKQFAARALQLLLPILNHRR
jgi:hypothetical protein